MIFPLILLIFKPSNDAAFCRAKSLETKVPPRSFTNDKTSESVDERFWSGSTCLSACLKFFTVSVSGIEIVSFLISFKTSRFDFERKSFNSRTTDGVV